MSLDNIIDVSIKKSDYNEIQSILLNETYHLNPKLVCHPSVKHFTDKIIYHLNNFKKSSLHPYTLKDVVNLLFITTKDDSSFKFVLSDREDALEDEDIDDDEYNLRKEYCYSLMDNNMIKVTVTYTYWYRYDFESKKFFFFNSDGLPVDENGNDTIEKLTPESPIFPEKHVAKNKLKDNTR